jgi:predicted amidohydrolase YtcJ
VLDASGSPFAAIATAITRQNAAGEPYGGWQPQERLPRETALAAWTAGGAYAGFADGRFGRLTKGERADFLLLDRDPLLATPAELRALRVLQTWVGGKLVYQVKDEGTAGTAER